MEIINHWYVHMILEGREIRCLHNVHLCTSDGLTLGQDGDCSLCHLLLLHNRRDLWAPAVWTHPDKMTCLVGLFRCMEQPPVKVRKQMLPQIRSASQPAPLWFCCAIHYTVVWQTRTETAVFPHVFLIFKRSVNLLPGYTWYHLHWQKVWRLWHLDFLWVAGWPCRTLLAWAPGEFWQTGRCTHRLEKQI